MLFQVSLVVPIKIPQLTPIELCPSKGGSMWPWMTSGVILHFMKKLHFINVSIHRNFYQNRLISKCVRRKKAKFLVSQSFSVRYRRTYVLKNMLSTWKYNLLSLWYDLLDVNLPEHVLVTGILNSRVLLK